MTDIAAVGGARARRGAAARFLPAAIGFGSFIAFLLAVEILIRIGVINRYIVPMPSQIALAFERLFVEEDILGRFQLTFSEALRAGVMITVVGVLSGIFLYRFELWRRATETWVAAMASAPTVLMYPCLLYTSPSPRD